MTTGTRNGLPHGLPPQAAGDPVEDAAATPRASRLGQWSVAAIAFVVTYVFSSGPVLAGACWLRETTGWDGCYAVFSLYWPIFAVLRLRPMAAYVQWWFWLFGTVGPG